MLSYYVLNDVFSSLDSKYKDQFDCLDRLFFSSNIITILKYYNFDSFSKNRYDLSDLIENGLQNDLFLFLIEEIKYQKYNSELILLVYGLLVNKAINEVSKPYFDSLCGVSEHHKLMRKKHILQRIISYKLRDSDEKFRFVKTKNIFFGDDLEIDTIEKIFSKVYKLSNTRKILDKAQVDFYNFHNQNINFLFFKLWKYKLVDKFCKSNISARSCLRTKLIKKKVDYLNLSKRAWINPYTNNTDSSSFLEIYDEIVLNAKKRIDHINEVIFYNKPLTTDVISIKDFKILNWDMNNSIFKKHTKFKIKNKK